MAPLLLHLLNYYYERRGVKIGRDNACQGLNADDTIGAAARNVESRSLHVRM
jgi:hypothetical protein